jgi:hypothetical protein
VGPASGVTRSSHPASSWPDLTFDCTTKVEHIVSPEPDARLAEVKSSRGAPNGRLRLPAMRVLLEEVRHAGFARSPGTLGPARRLELLRDLEGRRFETLPHEVGPVRQRCEALVVATGDVGYPAVARLAAALTDALTSGRGGISGVEQFVANQAVFSRYRGLGAGISPHRDHKRYAFLVAVFTLVGEAPFSVVADRAGQHVLASWMTAPGDLCLLRAPGFDGNDDGRPLHAVGAPTGEARISLAFRMDRRAARR